MNRESLRTRAFVLRQRAEHLRREYDRMQPNDVMDETAVLLLERAATSAELDYERADD